MIAPGFFMKSPLALFLASTALCGISSAVVVNVDFYQAPNSASDRFVGSTPVVPDAGTTWNHVTHTAGTVNASNLVTSTGVASGIGLSITGVTATGKIAAEQEHLGGFTNLMKDFLLLNSDPGNLMSAAAANSTIVTAAGLLSGLTAGGTYELYFYGQGQDMYGIANQNAGENSLFTINGVSKQTGWDGVDGGNGLLVEGIEYVKFVVQADGSGQIAFTWSNVVPDDPNTPAVEGNVPTDLAPNNSANVPKGSKSAGFNGLQIYSVPEPSAALLGSLGVLGLLVRRRR